MRVLVAAGAANRSRLLVLAVLAVVGSSVAVAGEQVLPLRAGELAWEHRQARRLVSLRLALALVLTACWLLVWLGQERQVERAARLKRLKRLEQ